MCVNTISVTGFRMCSHSTIIELSVCLDGLFVRLVTIFTLDVVCTCTMYNYVCVCVCMCVHPRACLCVCV